MKTIIFDIETGPLPEDRLRDVMPDFEAPANWKDPVKIEEYVREKQREWADKAALSAITGQVLAIGLQVCDLGEYPKDYAQGEPELLAQGEGRRESQVLADFWNRLGRDSGAMWVGFNIFGFDLPFLMRRSWACGVTVPSGLRQQGRYWHPRFIDLRDVWQCGDRQAEGSLDKVARCLGIPGKSGSGADFARLFNHPSTRDQALAYLCCDLSVTVNVARALMR